MRTESKKRRPTMADCLLEEEVKCAAASLNVSCGWAFSLSENVAHFENSFMSVQEKLEDLTERLRRERLDETFRRKVRNLLLQFRKYFRQMADESEPLRVDNIIEDTQRMYELERKLGKLMNSIPSES
ncbi:hypothetical protein [Bradyrhizobium sp. 62]|uniref:hypothetical protein n=1 Tax=Bradyrhizobium sp. 62 TaxID=1043588 RepID=UPI001FF8B47E|nr:hypothetical protein [Bradyrhizobium sp. 62]MCK1364079.1 hypothetical protein [Bradyrhizobium sp. 62]